MEPSVEPETSVDPLWLTASADTPCACALEIWKTSSLPLGSSSFQNSSLPVDDPPTAYSPSQSKQLRQRIKSAIDIIRRRVRAHAGRCAAINRTGWDRPPWP